VKGDVGLTNKSRKTGWLKWTGKQATFPCVGIFANLQFERRKSASLVSRFASNLVWVSIRVALLSMLCSPLL
jgi:hypothetical protein